MAAVAVALALIFAGWATVTALGRDTGGAPAAAVPGDDSADAGFARDMAVHHQQAVEMSFIVRDRTQDEEVRRLAYDIANTQANQRGMLLGWLDMWGLPKIAPDREPMAWMSGHGGHGASAAASPAASGHGGHDGHGASAPAASGHGGHASAGADAPLMPGMATKSELEQLRRASGRQAEILYLRLMTDHHKGGVAMAQGCVDQCRVTLERDLAQGMVDAQESEIALMTDLLAKRGAKPRG
ncbi:DUF305 domain-containing protein [Streptomyces coeruleoprunus]